MNRLQSATHTGRLRENYSPNYIVPSADRLFWYEPQQVTIATGVSTWTDIWGSNNVTQGTGANQPSYVDSGGPNSGPILTFDGTNDELTNTALSTAWTAGTSIDVYMLVKVVSWVQYDYLIRLRETGTNESFHIRMETGANRWEVGTEDGVGFGYAHSATGAADSSWHLVRGYLDASTAKVGVSIDGGTATESSTTATNAANKTRLAIGSNEGGGYGNLSTPFVFGARALLSLAQRVKLTRYVNQRWPAAAIAEPSA